MNIFLSPQKHQKNLRKLLFLAFTLLFYVSSAPFLQSSTKSAHNIHASTPKSTQIIIAQDTSLGTDQQSSQGSDQQSSQDSGQQSSDPIAQDSQNSATPPLYFLALNAGYKDESSSQNYDFITLKKSLPDNLSLDGLKITYTNSSGNLAGTLEFSDRSVLTSDVITLGFSSSPQYTDYKSTDYSYTFSSAGLASTAGMLQLYLGDTLLDEVCWGKLTCKNQGQKFATKAADNYTISRCSAVQESTIITPTSSATTISGSKAAQSTSFNSNAKSASSDSQTGQNATDLASDCAFSNPFTPTKAYYLIDPDAILTVSPETETPSSSCEGLQFSEIFSYYQNSASEQFIELFNPTNATISLNNCQLKYKNKNYPISGEITSGAYLALKNFGFALTKNPTSTLSLQLLEADGAVVAEASYSHGQKSNTSYALFYAADGAEFWQQTYAITPNVENILQEFQTCPVGKVINPETGNCIKSQESVNETKICPSGKYLNLLTGRCKNITTTATTTCKAGYYRNVLTNRCRKLPTAKAAVACKEGYERNPETNRCRKIRDNTGADYAVAPIAKNTHSTKKTFIAISAIVALVGAGFIFALIQFRQEIRRFLRKISRLPRKFFHSLRS